MKSLIDQLSKRRDASPDHYEAYRRNSSECIRPDASMSCRLGIKPFVHGTLMEFEDPIDHAFFAW